MAKLRKKKTTGSGTKRVAPKGQGLYDDKIDLTGYEVPGLEETNEPSDDFSEYIVGIYGPKGWGKSSFASQFGKTEETIDDPANPCLTIMLESQRRGLKLRQVVVEEASLADITSKDWGNRPTPWQEIKAYLQIAIEDDSVSVVAIDNFDLFCSHCHDHHCKRAGVTNPTNSNDHGKLWDFLKSDCRKTLEDVKLAGKGVVLTSHEKRVPIKDPFLGNYESLGPSLSYWPKQIWNYLVDFQLYGAHTVEGRAIFCRGNQFIAASVGHEDSFLASDDEGDYYPIASYSAEPSAKAAYLNTLAAFRNEAPALLFYQDLLDKGAEHVEKLLAAQESS